MIDRGPHSSIEVCRLQRYSQLLPIFHRESSQQPLKVRGRLLQNRKHGLKAKTSLGRVHRWTCSHYALLNVYTLLKRNGFWSGAVQNYLSGIIQDCSHSIISSLPPPSRKASPDTICHELNDLTFFNHLHLVELILVHMADIYVSWSAAVVLPNTFLNVVYVAFGEVCVTYSGS